MRRSVPTSVGLAVLIAGISPALLGFQPSELRASAVVPLPAGPQDPPASQDAPAPRDTAPPLTAVIEYGEQDAEEATAGESEQDAPGLPPYDSLELDTIPTSVSTGADLSTVTGVVREGSSGEPVTAAVVVIRRLAGATDGRLTTRTDDHGRFRFQGLPSGRYALDTHHIGYEDRADTLDVGVKVLVQLDVPVSAQAVELPPMQVTVRQGWLAETGFYYRKEAGFGKFLTPEDLDKRNAPRMTQVLRQVPGVEVITICGAIRCDPAIRFRQTNHYRICDVKYFMDGREMHGRVSVDNISPNDVAAVEIYRSISETPAQFYGRCGSVVIWSKRAEFSRSND